MMAYMDMSFWFYGEIWIFYTLIIVYFIIIEKEIYPTYNFPWDENKPHILRVFCASKYREPYYMASSFKTHSGAQIISIYAQNGVKIRGSNP